MEILETNEEKYSELVTPQYIYDSMEFNKLNSKKVDDVKYLVFQNSHKRFALCLGVDGKSLLCPFSAPFASIELLRKNLDISYLEETMDVLEQYIVQNGYESIRFILPPLFYDSNFLTALTNVLIRKKFSIVHQDINFQFDLEKVAPNYVANLARNAKKNLRIALDSNLEIEICDGIERKKRAYEIIAINREQKGYPLRMTFEQVKETMGIVKNDCFIVKKGQEEIASAIIFQVSDKVMQVIYWGDIRGYSEVKPINYLAYYLVEYYSKKGIQYLDIGPSTEAGVPNVGLCTFKTSIGCDMSPKFTFCKKYGDK